VQVNGKLRDTLTAPKGLPREALEEMALASDKVAAARRQGAAQGDRRARPAGEHRRMSGARPLLLARARCCSGCGLRPLYGGGGGGRSRRRCARSRWRRSPAGPAGWCARAGGPARAAARGARYRLEVELDDDITGFGIRGDDA
jgi:hypothetical protein